MRPFAGAEQLRQTGQIVSHHQHIRGIRRTAGTARAHRRADIRQPQLLDVADAVAHIGGRTLGRDGTHQEIQLGCFLLRQQTAVYGIDTGGFCRLLGRCLGIACQQDCTQNALIFQLAHRICRARTERILQYECTDILTLARNINYGFADVRHALNAARDHQLAVADQQTAALNAGPHAAAREFLELLDLGQRIPIRGNDGPRDWVL